MAKDTLPRLCTYLFLYLADRLITCATVAVSPHASEVFQREELPLNWVGGNVGRRVLCINTLEIVICRYDFTFMWTEATNVSYFRSITLKNA